MEPIPLNEFLFRYYNHLFEFKLAFDTKYKVLELYN